MPAVEDIGGGVAPGRRGVAIKETEVRKVPMWVPWDQGGKGSWRLVPSDNAHQMQMVTVSDGVRVAEPLYQKKGFVPEQYAPVDKLPLLIEKAEHAVEVAAAQSLPAPKWALGVLGRREDLVARSKAGSGGRADAA